MLPNMLHLVMPKLPLSHLTRRKLSTGLTGFSFMPLCSRWGLAPLLLVCLTRSIKLDCTLGERIWPYHLVFQSASGCEAGLLAVDPPLCSVH